MTPETTTCWCGNLASRHATGYICEGSIYHDPLAAKNTDPGTAQTIYVAGPMSGFPENNYPEFHRVSSILRNKGFNVVSPAEYGAGEGGSRVSYSDLLKEDLRKMLECDAVCTLDGWEHSTGARNEVMVAGVCGMPVKSIGGWLMIAATRSERKLLKSPLV